MSGEGVAFREALRAWARIAIHSFGGPAGQIAVIHRVVVEEKKWLSERSFLHALGYCMLLPGPEAQQLATYVGWKTHGVRGGLTAGGLFILPGFLSILILSLLYVGYGQSRLVEAVFHGVKPAVIIIVVQALFRLRRRTLAGPLTTTIAAAAFLAMFALDVPFPLVIATAARCRGQLLAADGDLDGEAVGHLRARIPARIELVGAVHALEHLALDEPPPDRAVAVPVVLEGVLVLDRAGVQLEVDLVSPATGALLHHVGLLHALGPLRVGVEVGDHCHDLGRLGVHHDAGRCLFGHGARCLPLNGRV